MEKILIIEDNDEINKLLREMLETTGYEVKSAFSGPEGFLYFDQENYSLVLLDLMLPGMSGEEVLKKIREKSTVPVIVISAKNEIESKLDLLENGAAADYDLTGNPLCFVVEDHNSELAGLLIEIRRHEHVFESAVRKELLAVFGLVREVCRHAVLG